MLKPRPAIARASDTATGIACHHDWTTKTSSAQEPITQVRMATDFRYMAGWSRSRRPVERKYSATRWRTAAWNPVSVANFGRRATGVLLGGAGNSRASIRLCIRLLDGLPPFVGGR